MEKFQLPDIQNIIQYILSILTPYVGEIIGDNKCWFWRNRSITYQTHCIRQKREKKMVAH